MYIELHASSAFSFLDGASLPEALVERAAALGYPALALLDRDGVYGVPRFHLAARRAGLKAIVGAELTVSLGARGSGLGVRGSGTGRTQGLARRDDAAKRRKSPESRAPSPEPRIFRLPVLVASREGYQNLCRLVTRMKLAAPKGEGALTLDDLDGAVGGLVALAGRARINGPRFGVGGLVDRLVGTFGARTSASSCSAICCARKRPTIRRCAISRRRFTCRSSPPTACASPSRRSAALRRAHLHPAQDDARARRTASELERGAVSEAARRHGAALRRPAGGDRRHARAGGSSRVHDGGSRLSLSRLSGAAGETMASFLRKIAQAGARERYRPYHDRARAQIERELDLIEKLDLAGYFLIVWDIVNFCRQEDILVQGRGSAANSAVCYSLGITAVDPVGMDLLFERFLSEERGEWPDIDLDLPSGDRRERVIQHVYEKYGKHGAAMTANVITYRGRSAAREVGKVLSLEAGQIDRLAKVMNHFEWVDPKDTLERNLRDVGIDGQHPSIQPFGELWTRIQDLPRHLGQHSGGMVICQGRLDDVVPLENASMPDRVVIQWDKDDCADMGLVKVDLLGLGMMAVLQDALKLVNAGIRDSGLGARDSGAATRAVEPEPQATSQIPNPGSRTASREPRAAERAASREPRSSTSRTCPPTIRRSTGCCRRPTRSGSSRSNRARRWRRCRGFGRACFYDIVVEVAIIRPGPIVGQMVHPYLKRRQGLEDVVYPHPALEPILVADARCAALPGTVAAHGDGGGRVFRWRGRRAAPRDGVQALRETHAAARGPAAHRHGAAGDRRRAG